MASPSSVRLDSADENSRSPADEIIKPINDGHPNGRVEPQNPSSPSVFLNSEPVREDQVQNAVKFLSHPKVRGSPVVHRRSFLEKKGLTKEEIDEAFRRVPDPSSNAQNPTADRDGRTTVDLVPPMPTQRANIQTITPLVSVSTDIKARPWFRWYHGVIAIALFTVSGAGTAIVIKNFLVPRLKSWIRKVAQQKEDSTAQVVKPNAAEEAAVAAAAAAVEVAKTNQELLKSVMEDKKHLEGFIDLLNLQAQEIKSLNASIDSLKADWRPGGDPQQENNYISVSHTMPNDSNGMLDLDELPAKPPSLAPHSKSYMEIMSMIQRGERPPNIRDIDDQPPNPNQPIPNPNQALKAKPWETSNPQYNPTQVFQSQSVKSSSSRLLENNATTTFENNVPWWQKKKASVSEFENIESFNEEANEQRVERSWVPPKPPPVMMPEAAEAIRRPKSVVSKDQTSNGEKPASDFPAMETDVPTSSESGHVAGASNIEIHEET